MLSGRMPVFIVICWMLSTGPLAARSTAQEITPLPSAQADLFSKVTLTPGPLAHQKHEQEKTNSTQTAPQQQQAPQQQALQQQASAQQSDTSHDRLFWALPNFLTVENAENVPPLTPGQKFKLVARGIYDPMEFVLVGFVAGLGQASDSDPSYGHGAQGYAKRYGTSYGDNAIENFMAYAVFPSVLHQDPRFYQLGHGGFRKRAIHAIGRVVITRSDSGQTQFNYSELLGAGSAAAISTYAYHPQSERSFGNVASVFGTQMGWDVATYLVKEFWPDLRKKKDKQQ
ncbi:MAG TPA: hypothetical protein VK770_00235 [Candidatus Acidoferrum sp.]|nr:hypothetical protein [Candidatus Acidoferrum sp.]